MNSNTIAATAINPNLTELLTRPDAILSGCNVKKLYLVGGTCMFPGMAQVVQEFTGIETVFPGSPLFVTPLGIAMHN